MSALTVKGTLRTGVEVDGKRYRAFTLRPVTLGDHVAAADTLAADAAEAQFAVLAENAVFDGLERDAVVKMLNGMFRRALAEGVGATANELRYARLARCIAFDGLPQERVTLDLLMSLYERDAEIITRAEIELEGKLEQLSGN